MLEIQKEFIDEVMDASRLQLEAVTLLGQASDVQSFNEALTKLSEAGVDLQASGADKVEGEVKNPQKS